MKRYCNYLYEIDDVPEYYGKGQIDRWYDHLYRKDNSPWKNHLQKAVREERKVVCHIFPRSSEQEAFSQEILNIARYGRRDLGTGTLYNLSDGGEGEAGRVDSAETRAKKSARMMGNTYGSRKDSDETRAKKSASRIGLKHSDETRAKIGKAHKGMKRSAETCAKISAAGKGRVAWNKGLKKAA